MDSEPAVGKGEIPKGFKTVQYHSLFVQNMRDIDEANRLKKCYKIAPFSWGAASPRPVEAYRGARRNKWRNEKRLAKQQARAWKQTVKALPAASFVQSAP